MDVLKYVEHFLDLHGCDPKISYVLTATMLHEEMYWNSVASSVFSQSFVYIE